MCSRHDGSDVETVGSAMTCSVWTCVVEQLRSSSPSGAAVEHLLGPFDEERHPSDVAFGKGDLEAGQALEIAH